jgi:hypothetical protein
VLLLVAPLHTAVVGLIFLDKIFVGRKVTAELLKPMKKSDFFENLIDYSKGENFSFYIPGGQFNDPKRLSDSRQKIYKMIFAGAVGIGGAIGGVNSGVLSVGILNSGDWNSPERDALITDLQEIHNHCDFASIPHSY